MEQVERGQVDPHSGEAVLLVILKMFEEHFEVLFGEVLLLAHKLFEGFPILLLRLGVLLLVERHLLGLRQAVDVQVLQVGQDAGEIVCEAAAGKVVVTPDQP